MITDLCNVSLKAAFQRERGNCGKTAVQFLLKLTTVIKYRSISAPLRNLVTAVLKQSHCMGRVKHIQLP